LYALENGVPEEEPTDERWTRIESLMVKKGVRQFQLLLDPHVSDGDGWKERYFDGYLTDTHPEWDGQFGTVVYNQFGQIVGAVKSGDAAAVVKIVKDNLK
jgi:hypothetical protein